MYKRACRQHDLVVPPRSFDRATTRWVVALLLTLVAVVALAGAVGATSYEGPAVVRLGFVVLAAASVWYAGAFFGQHLSADDDGVHVRNLVGGYTLSWDEIHHFEAPPAP